MKKKIFCAILSLCVMLMPFCGIMSYADDGDELKTIQLAWGDVSNALKAYEATNDTTEAELAEFAKSKLPPGSDVTFTTKNFKMSKATEAANGGILLDFIFQCGKTYYSYSIRITIPAIRTDSQAALTEDRNLASSAMSKVDISNNTTKEELLEAAKSAIKNGSEVYWQENFQKTNATTANTGRILGWLTFKLDDEVMELRFSEKIPKIQSSSALRNMPADISVSIEEWEILRLSNIERTKVNGTELLGMTAALQNVCDLREEELLVKYSHTRPNGYSYDTALTQEVFSHGRSIENIGNTKAVNPAESIVEEWMNSTGHRLNILNTSNDYMGVGYRDGYAVQFITNGAEKPVSYTTSTGSFHFTDDKELEKEYLIGTTASGMKSYIPLDMDCLTYYGNGKFGMKLFVEDNPVITFDNVNPRYTDYMKFDDVTQSDYYAQPVGWAVSSNITAGTSDTTFSPDKTCTRAQILTFLWRSVGSPKSYKDNPFTDISEKDYYYDAAVWAAEKGMVAGSTFNADKLCTRAEAVTYIWINSGSPTITQFLAFEDVIATADYAMAVGWAVKSGITSGVSDTEFAPGTTCTRAQIVTFLDRAYNGVD